MGKGGVYFSKIGRIRIESDFFEQPRDPGDVFRHLLGAHDVFLNHREYPLGPLARRKSLGVLFHSHFDMLCKPQSNSK